MTTSEMENTVSMPLRSDVFYEYYCQPCDSDGHYLEAVGFCLDCQEYLCEECYKYHRRQKMARDHSLQDKKQMLRNRTSASVRDTCTKKCERHQDEFVRYFCPVHNSTGCGDCITVDHRSCDGVKRILDASADIEHNEEYIAFTCKLSKTRQNATEIISVMNRLTEKLDKCSAKVQSHLQEIRNALKDRLDELDKDLEKIEHHRLEETKRIMSISDKCIATETQIETVVENLMKMNGEHSNKFISITKEQDKVEILGKEIFEVEQTQIVQEYNFEPNQHILDELRKCDSLGKLSLKSVKSQNRVGHVTDIQVKTRHDTKRCSVSASLILSDSNNLVIIDSNNFVIKIIDTTDNHITKEFRLKSRPWDVTKINESKMAVTMPDEMIITSFTTKPSLHATGFVSTKGRCMGVAHGEDKLFVTFIFSHKVEVMDMSGNTLLKITNGNSKDQPFNCPYHIAISPDNQTMYVSNYLNNTVLRLGLDGKLLSTYDKLTGPRKVTVDDDGMVYVCDGGSSNIHKLTPDCQFVQVVKPGVDGLNNLVSITLCDKTKKVYAGLHNENHMKIFLREHEHSTYSPKLVAKADSN